MAIAKNDMFDFLIDIVPREEIHTRTKTVRVCEIERKNDEEERGKALYV